MYALEYLPSVKKDVKKFDKHQKMIIRGTIESKLRINPIIFGKPLQYSMKGCRRLRVGDFRVIYRIKNHSLLLVKIAHHKEFYE